MTKRRVLITGALSLIGSNYINYSLKRGTYELIVALDKVQFPGTESNINSVSDGTCIFIKGDMGDEQLVSDLLHKYHVDTLIHFGAYSHVDSSLQNPLSFTENNVLGTQHLLEACRRYRKLRLFLNFSTDEIYGEVPFDHPGCAEHAPFCPTNPYSASKASAEMICNAYHYSYGIPLVTLRCNNAFGENQHAEKLIPRFIMLLKRGDRVTIHGKGEARRNFIHTDDISTAIDTTIEKGELGQIYNIGTNDEYSVLDIAHMLVADLKGEEVIPDEWIEFVPDRLFNDSLYRVDTTKLRSLGWEPKADFRAKLRELYK